MEGKYSRERKIALINSQDNVLNNLDNKRHTKKNIIQASLHLDYETM